MTPCLQRTQSSIGSDAAGERTTTLSAPMRKRGRSFKLHPALLKRVEDHAVLEGRSVRFSTRGSPRARDVKQHREAGHSVPARVEPVADPDGAPDRVNSHPGRPPGHHRRRRPWARSRRRPQGYASPSPPSISLMNLRSVQSGRVAPRRSLDPAALALRTLGSLSDVAPSLAPPAPNGDIGRSLAIRGCRRPEPLTVPSGRSRSARGAPRGGPRCGARALTAALHVDV
jgi:hypothetical protein